MAKHTKEKKKKPQTRQVFSAIKTLFIYIPVSLAVILVFRVIFPSQAAPLPVFSLPWRLTEGTLDFITLFPALGLAALIISFGFQRGPDEEYGRFSLKFLDTIKGHILAAIIITAFHALLYLAAYPLVLDYQSTMTFNGYLFRTSREKAILTADEGSWKEAGQFLAICEKIWPQNPELEGLRVRILLGSEDSRAAGSGGGEPAGTVPRAWVPGGPLEAFALAQEAFTEERYYDAHWLATLAGRMARPGSAESLPISQLAAKAWNAIASLESTGRERAVYDLYRKKREGYNALLSGEWIQAYYVFKELAALTPEDPDAASFLAMSEDGLKNLAFFIDEMDMAIGEVLTQAVFSVPRKDSTGNPGGRTVLRFSSLSNFPDFSYAEGIEALGFNADGSVAFRLEAPYGKIVPLVVPGGPNPAARETVLLMRALDREDKNISWEPNWQGEAESELGKGQLSLNIFYDDFLLSSRSRRGPEGLSFKDLFAGAARLGSRGHIAEIFQAEILRRTAESLMLLPLTISAIITGWRFRAHKKPKFIGIPMLALIPAVCAFVIAYLRNMSENTGILAIMTMGFSAAMAFLTGVSLIVFILALIILAGQRA